MTEQVKRKHHDALDDLLDRPISYNPAFKRITHNTVASIFLSQAWYWSKRHKDDDGWFFNTQAEWEDQTGLTRYEQETARKHCRELEVIEEKLKGAPARLHYRVCKEKVYELLGVQFAETPQTEIAATPQTSLDDLPQFAAKQQSGVSTDFNKESSTSTNTSTSSSAAGSGKAIFKLYEENVGPITGMLSDFLKDAEKKYPALWIEDAFAEAVKNNKRNWKYIEAILKRWKRDGKDNGKTPVVSKPLPPPEVEPDRAIITPEVFAQYKPSWRS